MTEVEIDKKCYDVVVIGAGMAGMTAAIYGRRAGKSVLVLEDKVYGGQILDTLRIENWPGSFGISGSELMKKVYQHMNNLDVTIEYDKVIKILDKSEYKEVVGEDGIYRARTVILAMGTKPRELSEKQRKDAGKRAISYCATCDGALYKGKPVVVVGSGNTARYEIEYLKGIASEVYHVHHDDPIPSDAEAVFVAIGRIPNTGFLKDFLKLDKDGYVVAGEDCKTSHEGVFVAGDCRTKVVRQLVTAAADGAVAAGAAVDFLNR